MTDLRNKADLFRSLHTGAGVLVLANAWDAISARIVEAEGYTAVASSSAAMAAVLGYPDGQRIPRSEMIFLISKIAAAVDVPVSADVEAGYGDAVQTVNDLLASGVVGMNLEDMVDDELLPLAGQLETIRAVRRASDAAGVPLVVNARTDIFLARHGDPATRFERSVERLNAFHDAGADSLFAPGVVDADTIGRLADAVNGPLNILATVGTPPIAELQRLGVKRVSLGSGTSRIALGALRRFVRALRDEGSFAELESLAIPFPDVQALLHRQ